MHWPIVAARGSVQVCQPKVLHEDDGQILRKHIDFRRIFNKFRLIVKNKKKLYVWFEIKNVSVCDVAKA